MAWTAPRTWVTSETVTASMMNTHVRDNMLETAPAKASGANQFFISTGANALVARSYNSEFVNPGAESTTSTSYTDLTTAGPAVSVTTGTSVLVWVGALTWNTTAGSHSFMGVAVSGATTTAATDVAALVFRSGTASQSMQSSMIIRMLVTAGSNTFTSKYRVDSGTGNWSYRVIVVLPVA